MTGTTQRNLLLAGLGSFAVYLMPVYTVHVSMPWGTILWMEVIQAGAGRGVWWFAGDLGLALLLQASAGALIYWLLGRLQLWRLLIVLTMAPVFFVALQAGYLYVLPNLFLIEGETHAEHGDWATICAVPGAAIAPVEDGPSAALLRAEEAWIVTAKGRYARLTAARCRTRNLPIGVRNTTVLQVVPGGGALFASRDGSTRTERLYLLRPRGRPRVLPPPQGADHWRPVLAGDASALAWAERRPAKGGGIEWKIRVRPLGQTDAAERAIPIRLPRPASLRLIGFDSEGPGFLARRNERELVAIDGEGRVSPLPEAPDPQTEPTHQFVRMPAGWISWDVYRDEGRHRIAWRLNGKAGAHQVPKGRGINHVSVNPEGTLIAVSVGPNLSIGAVKDSVYVLRAADGQEVFRRFFPRYTRSRPTFLGNRHLAVTEREGRVPLIRVVRVPAEVRAP